MANYLKCFKRNLRVFSSIGFNLKKGGGEIAFWFTAKVYIHLASNCINPYQMTVAVTDLPGKQSCSLLRKTVHWGMSPFYFVFLIKGV